MKNPSIILKIAGLSLKIPSFLKIFLEDTFKHFLFPEHKVKSHFWHLELKRIKKRDFYKEKFFALKKRLANFKIDLKKINPYYYPIKIDSQNKRILYFSSNTKKVNSSFIPYLYSLLLALNKGILLHAACVVKQNKAYLFLGSTGEGKSTVAWLSQNYLVLSDDVLAVKKIKNQFIAFATPWKQKPFIQPKPYAGFPLKAIFFLKKAKRIFFKPLKKEAALVRILSSHIHFFLFTERPLVDKLFFTAVDLVKSIPSYEMEFMKDKDFWPNLERVLINNKYAKRRA